MSIALDFDALKMVIQHLDEDPFKYALCTRFNPNILNTKFNNL